MPQALIEINAVAGSNNDLPINTSVQLSNADTGGESTYLWAIVDQPPGTADTLSASNIENPTFTPKKEGTYLLRLIVNQGLADQRTDTAIVGVKELRSGARIPAAGETDELADGTGWALDVNAALRLGANLQYADCIVGVLDATMAQRQVVYVSDRATLKSGLPGEEKLPKFTKALASSSTYLGRRLYVIEDSVAGSYASGAVVRARQTGYVSGLALAGASLGDAVYVSNTATLALTAGTYKTQVGKVVWTNGTLVDVVLDGSPMGFRGLYADSFAAMANVEQLPGTLTLKGGLGPVVSVEDNGLSDSDVLLRVQGQGSGSGTFGYARHLVDGTFILGSDGAFDSSAKAQLASKKAGTLWEHTWSADGADAEFSGPAGSTGLLTVHGYVQLASAWRGIALNDEAVFDEPSDLSLVVKQATGSEIVATKIVTEHNSGAPIMRVGAFEADLTTKRSNSFIIGDQLTHAPLTFFSLQNKADGGDELSVYVSLDAYNLEGEFSDADTQRLDLFTIDFAHLVVKNLEDPSADGEALSWGYAKKNLAPTVLFWGMSIGPTAGNTSHPYPGYVDAAGLAASTVRVPVPFAGKVSNLRVHCDSGSSGDSWTVAVLKNGASSGLDKIVSAGTTDASSNTTPFTVVAGDVLNVQVASGASMSVQPTKITVSVELTVA